MVGGALSLVVLVVVGGGGDVFVVEGAGAAGVAAVEGQPASAESPYWLGDVRLCLG